MSKSRNRNLRNFAPASDFHKTDIAKFPSYAQNSVSPIYCFGESITTYKPDGTKHKNFDQLSLGSTNESDILNFVSDHDGSLDKSCSSSSLSWADDYEEGVTRQVENAIQKMENVLLQNEPVPANYDAEEYGLWIHTFSSNRLLGKQEKHIRRQIKSTSRLENMKPCSSSSNHFNIGSLMFACDKSSTSLEKFQSAVMNETLESASVHFAEQKDSTIKRKKQKPKIEKFPHDHESKLFHNLSLDAQFESLLRISRAPVVDTPSRNLESQRGSNVIARSQVSASKWLRGDSPEYSSMPYLMVEQCSPRPARDLSAISVKGKSRYDVKRKPPSSIGKPRTSKLSPRSTYITLPPIKQTTSTSQYRSISATPRHQSKSSSALSVNSLFGRRRFDIENCLYINERNKNSSLIPRLQIGSLRKL